MKKLIILLVLIFSGCVPWSTNHDPEYDLAQSVVVVAWIDQFENLQDRTWDALDNYNLVEVDFSDSNPCTSPRAVGCYYPTNDIFINTRRTQMQRGCTLIHELEHLMSYYEFGDIQMHHDNELLWADFGHDTLEYRACKTYKEAR